MPALNEADAVYIGSQRASRVYLGSNLVWPIQIPGLCMWVDAMALPNATQNITSYWPSSVPGSGHHMVVNGGPGTQPPQLQVGGGPKGMNAVAFWGGHWGVHSYSVGDAAGAAMDREFSIFVVARMWGSVVRRVVSGITSNCLVGWWQGEQDRMYINAWWNGTPVTNDGQWKLYTAWGSGTSAWLYNNGNYIGGLSDSAAGWGNQIALSGWPDETSDCYVCELVCFNRFIGEPARAQVERYLRSKWF